MAKKHLKKSSTSLVIKEMQIETTLRFHDKGRAYLGDIEVGRKPKT
jgi:hypothetical protein